MKNTVAIFLFFVSTSLFSQGTTMDSTKKEHKNIISIDATGLFTRLFNFSGNNFYSSPYLISYRRIIKNNALKVSIGGDVNTANGKMNDSLKSSSSRSNLNLAIGFEHYQYLGKRWTFFFGIDATTYFSNNNSKSDRTTNSYYESKNNTTSYGLAPTLGIVFQITKRISLSTETSYNIAYQKTVDKSVEFPSVQYNRSFTSTGIQTIFIPPTSLNFRFKF